MADVISVDIKLNVHDGGEEFRKIGLFTKGN
jgi:hypothetical protein